MTTSKSLAACMAEARANGYQEVFRMKEMRLISADDATSYESSKIVIEDFQPVTNPLDPAKRSTIYLIETPDKRKGMVVDHHHTSSPNRFSHFMSQH